ncbi:hypothetical protein BaRGS_00009534 [Batillaria attramentaria]|uniref:RZ-type domain-containing protein n=1 Tax=Batillaria attramentaria TaxID=370345 RepID=A0ABD0LIE4_9CAEN
MWSSSDDDEPSNRARISGTSSLPSAKVQSQPRARQPLVTTHGFCSTMKGNSDSNDSDSSSGSDVTGKAPKWKTLNLHSIPPKPKPRSSLQAKPDGRSQATQLSSRDKPKPAGGISGSKLPPDVRPKQKLTPAVLSSDYKRQEVPTNTREHRSGSASASKGSFQKSSREDLSLKQYLVHDKREKPQHTRDKPHPTASVYGQASGRFEEGSAHGYSKREEKLSLSEFLPEGIHSKEKHPGARRNEHVATSGVGARAPRQAEGRRDPADQNSLNSARMRIDDRGNEMAGRPYSATQQRISGRVHDQVQVRRDPAEQNTLNLARLKIDDRSESEDGRVRLAAPRRTGSNQPRMPHQRAPGAARNRPTKNGSGSTDDSDDETSLEKLLPTARRYVPPRRQHAPDGHGADRGDRYPAGNQRQRAGSGNFGGAEDDRDFDRNWRDRPDQRNAGDGRRHPDEGAGLDDRNRRQAPQPARGGHEPHEDARENRRFNVPPARDEDDQNDEARMGNGGRNGQGRHQNGNRQQNRPPPRGPRPAEVNLHFTRLRELKSKDPAEVLTALSYSKEGLKILLKNENKLTTDTEMTKLVLNALAKVSNCNSMPSQQSAVLNVVRASSFLRILGTFLCVSGSSGSEVEVNKIIGDSADLAKTLLALFSSVVHDVVMIYSFIETAQKQAELRGLELTPEVVTKVEDLEVAKTAALEALRYTSRNREGKPEVDEDSLTPPDDFRALSVFPTMADLDKEELPFLRKNKPTGGYSSADHYLDVQFRLLREDFVYPLREGIQEYLKTVAAPHRGKRLKDIRVYHGVHVLRAVCLQNGLGHRLNFDVSHMKRVRWEVSKRLIYGSLVCLSSDNFQTELFFATVANREPSDLKEGIVDVTFEHDLHELAAISPETVFTMAETTAFFEAYRHVLSGLQNIRDNQLPFQRYIVQCNKNVQDPSYLADSRNPTYDLRPLVDDKMVLREDRQLQDQGREVGYNFSAESRPADDVSVLHREEWPDNQLLKLDASQFEALYRALTKEFSVIQGPPGTGKTYVGLKIVKALLHNRKSWDPELKSSMLIVCYTNHALDQFLEGVVSFFKGSVVRVGSRLRSEALQKYTLNNLRWEKRRNRDDADRDFREITRLRFQGNDAMDNLKRQMDTIGLKIEGAKMEILHEDVLRPYMSETHYERLQDARPYLHQQAFIQRGKTKKKLFCMAEWLGIGSVLQNRVVTAEDLETLDQELGEDELEIEGEIQAMEERNRLDTEDNNDRDKKKKAKKKELEEERSRYLALDISKLDSGRREQGDGDGFQIPTAHWRKIKRKLRRNVSLDDRMTGAQEKQIEDLWGLDFNERWRLYRLWTYEMCRALQTDMREMEELYDQLARRQKETLMQEDKHILKTATVIAMTTTGAAKYQSVLQEVKPKIVVVEEAAEVLEGHVITTLSQDCQHLILIGDHKQLRPNPTVYHLARKYNLELSLFERMINNGLRCVTLGWQHRMRPEIASLVKSIYPELKNHESVLKYEDVKGISSNVFFINHSFPETNDDETKSHSNNYEALYLAQLTSYLLKQGYHPSRITVLTTYSGQLFQLKKLMPKKQYEGVRLTVVDNFQGEENDIILLSLVRSNEDSNIGFLKIENRVCVALSRAKIGLFVIGNFDVLSAESELWQTITTNLKKEGRLGEALRLYCQNHPQDDGLVIRAPEDFNLAPEGGCMKRCSARLDCGHVCTLMCHPYDQEHKEFGCRKPCERKMNCDFQHPCRKKCFENCGECMEPVEKMMPKCGHVMYIPCCVRVEDFICQADCEVRLPCGHLCGDRCGERHRCYETVEHTWPCGHSGIVYCSAKDTEKCTAPCRKQLACGHQCAGLCHECSGGRLHKTCRNRCTRILVCGHKCKDTCSNCPPCEDRCANRCPHSVCPKRCGLPCALCKERCQWRCPHFRCTRLCCEPCDRPRCDEPCPELLKCDHPCIGVCGEPCPNLCRICDREEVTEILFGTEEEPDAMFVQLEDCGHVLEVSGLDTWMETTTSEHEDSVQLRACPKCKTLIRKNLRYGAIIKQQLQDIELIKARLLGDEDKREEILLQLEGKCEAETDSYVKGLKEDILEAGDDETLGGLVCMQNQMKLLDECKKLAQIKKKKLGTYAPTAANFVMALSNFEKWVVAPRLMFRDQEASDAQTELQRLQHWLRLLIFQHLAEDRGVKLPGDITDPMQNTLLRMKNGLLYTESHQEATKTLISKLEELVPESGLGISDKERVMILKAMQLNTGHWYKCPKGHVYAIGDCGGANQGSRCPECKAAIGGVNYRLAEGNTLASEMDGAQAAAWSERNNLNNYGFNIAFED